MVTKKTFTDKISKLPATIPSKTGTASYTNFILENNILSFQRVKTKKNWDLDIEVLWSIYLTYAFINTTVVKNVMGKRVNSPSIAVLMAIGCIDATGKRL